MKKPQVHISAEGGNFLRIGENLVNFGFGGLPDQVHFSFSLHPNHPLINFHVTKEVPDRGNKPQIRIFEISKIDWKHLQSFLPNVFFKCFYEPLAIPYQQHLSRKDFYKRVAFMAFDDITAVPPIWDKSKIKKGKLRMTTKNLANLEGWATQPHVHKLFTKQFYTLPWRPYFKPQHGYLISPSYTGLALILNGQYFKPRPSFEPKEVLHELFDDSLTRALMAKTFRALRQIEITGDRQTSSKYSQPLLLQPIPMNINCPPLPQGLPLHRCRKVHLLRDAAQASRGGVLVTKQESSVSLPAPQDKTLYKRTAVFTIKL